MHRQHHFGIQILAVVAAAALAGCGGVGADYSQVDLNSVGGTITLDGQPLANAIVVFEAPDQTYSYAQTDESGRYRLLFNTEKAGVTPGPKVVRIRTSGGLGEELEGPTEEGPEMPAEPEKVPPCYNSRSQLKANVDGSSGSFNFDLKSDCSVTGPT